LIILSLCVGFGAWLVFIWAVKKGEFDDVEGPKYRMLDEEDDFPERSAKSEGEAHED
jgi:cbb3-type cytochrome oxidase maturation protein